MKKFIRFLLILITCLAVCAFGLFFYAERICPYIINLHYLTIYSSKIPKEMDNVSMVYFSDLLYGKLTSEKTIEKAFDKINKIQPDIVIFGGDLFDMNYTPNTETIEQMETYIKSIEAPLGKYAVLGEMDDEKSHKKVLTTLFFDSDVEILDNTNMTLGNHDTQCIRIIGIHDEDKIAESFKNISSEEYNIVISHQPDLLASDSLSSLPVDYALAGNSHGTQVSYPYYGGYGIAKGSKYISKDNLVKLPFSYYITTGIGCTQIPYRFGATPEICYIVLRNK